MKRPVLHPGRRRGTGEEQPGWAGEEKEGSESQAEPGARVEDGTDTREERETPTQRKRDRREDNVSVGPGPPAHLDRHLPDAAKQPPGL